MASITRRGSSFLITVSNGRDENGKQILIRETYHLKKPSRAKIPSEVKDYARKLEQKVKDGEYCSGETMTFDECVEIWDQHRDLQKKKLSISTRERYLQTLRGRVSKYIGKKPISRIKTPEIQAIYKDMVEEGKTASTIQKTHVIINSVFKFAYRMDIISHNPCDKCFVPEVEKMDAQKLHYFTMDQAKRFLDSIDKEFESERKGCIKTIHEKEVLSVGYSQTIRPSQPKMWKAYFSLAIGCGMRRGELIGLNWDKVDFKARTIRIDQAVARTKEYGQIIKDPKSKSSNRTVPLPEGCIPILKEWKNEQMRMDFRMGTAWADFKSLPDGSRPVFVQIETGKRMDLSSPTRKFKELLDRYNKSVPDEEKLPEIRLHDLRHTYATQQLANGVDVITVSYCLGHSKNSVTLDVYAHATEKNIEKAGETFSMLFA